MSDLDRLNRAIPGGAHTYSRGADQFPVNAPALLDRGEGAYVWDTQGRRYLDYGMALRSVTLGYAHPAITAAAIREIERGNNLTRASATELAAAECLIDLIPGVEMVKFGKNGSNVTTAAVKIARAYTGRRYVCVPRQHPFFSFDDWFIGVTPMTRGIPASHAETTLVFDFNDLSSLERLFEMYPGQIAAVMLEPATTITPCPSACNRTLTWDGACATACPHLRENFLHQVQALCRAQGSLLILDEMITGFRWHLQGAQHYFGIQPDLSTFGKGMANGFSVAAVGGRREIMEVGAINRPGAERVFLLSTTHGGEMSGLGAFRAAVRVYQEQHVCRHLWEYGAALRDGLIAAAQDAGYGAHFRMDGPAISLNYVTLGADGAPSLPMRTLFSQEMIRHGVLMPWIAVSLAHGPAELTATLDAARQAFAVCASAVREGVDTYLEGPAIKPVFRQFN